MGAIVLLIEDDASAVPGEETRRAAQICNVGSVVDRFELDIVGEAKGWIRVEPAEVNVFPDQSVGVELVFTPPRSPDLPAGEVPFALRVMSHEDIEGSAVEEATVNVGSFTDFGVRLAPRTKRTRLGARLHAVVDNRGNAPLKARLHGAEADNGLAFAFAYPDIEVAPGKGALVPVRIKPTNRRWRGRDRTLPFRIVAVHQGEDGEEERTADGVVVHAALVSDAAVRFAVAVVAAVLALIALWMFVLQPSVESEARKQASAVTGPDAGASGTEPSRSPGPPPGRSAPGGGAGAGGLGSTIQPAPPPPPPDEGAGGGGQDGGGAGENTGKSPDPDEGPNAGTSASDFRVEADAPLSAEFVVGARYSVPEGSTLLVSDVVFENVAGDKGVMRLQRGDSVLRQLALDTFSNHDEHYEEPIVFRSGEDVVLAVRCREAGEPATGADPDACTPAAYFSGRLVTAVP